MDEVAAAEEALIQQRAPLNDRYAPFVAGEDTCLTDARRRLHTAISQTRQLRAAFTERVYGKYRVCLRPPPVTNEVISNIESDPTQLKVTAPQLKVPPPMKRDRP